MSKCATRIANIQQLSITINPPSNPTKVPSHICLVIDISGSMNSSATVDDGSSGGESSGLTVLDVVKHSCKTVVNLLSASDQLSIVTYSTSAKVVSNPMSMTPANKTLTLSRIDALQTEGSTNIWDGLLKAMELVKTNSDKIQSSIFLLTDGLPNVVPPRGHLPMLSRYQDANPAFSADIHTFGFGYNLDSGLLLSFAVAGGGGFSFVPDSGFVGTTFCHSVANVLTTIGQKAKLKIELPNFCSLEKVHGVSAIAGEGNQLQHEIHSWGVEILVGALHFEQPRTYILDVCSGVSSVDGGDFLATVVYSQIDGSEIITTTNNTTNSSNTQHVNSFTLNRLSTVETISSIIKRNCDSSEASAESKRLVKQLISSVAETILLPSPQNSALLEDLKTQVTEAVSSDKFWNKVSEHDVSERSGGGQH